MTDRNPIAKGWLDAVVAAELDRHDPAAALARLPADVREAGGSSTDLAPAARLLVARSLRLRRLEPAPMDPGATFREEARLHVALLLDLAVLRGTPHDRPRRRAEIAAFLAAAVGELDEALEVLSALPPAPAPVTERAGDAALHAVERALAERFYPPGDPVLGLPLHPGLVAILRRKLARVAMGYHRDGRLDPDALARHSAFAERETVMLVEALAALLGAERPADDRARAVRQKQVARLGLSRTAVRKARAAIASPRTAAAIAVATPPAVRPFLVEQLHLALLRARLAGEAVTRTVEAFVAAAELDAPTVAAARVEAAAQHGDHQVWFEAIDPGGLDLPALASEWEDAADAMVERVSAAVSFNLGAVMTELRETGELAELLARAASGAKLGAEERRKVRAQLIDLAKAVPALAIFAAPGGMLLLPLLAKLLPFNLLPGAWDRPAPDAKGGAGGGTPAAAPSTPRGKPKRAR